MTLRIEGKFEGEWRPIYSVQAGDKEAFISPKIKGGGIFILNCLTNPDESEIALLEGLVNVENDCAILIALAQRKILAVLDEHSLSLVIPIENKGNNASQLRFTHEATDNESEFGSRTYKFLSV